jgi:hypothetical protein
VSLPSLLDSPADPSLISAPGAASAPGDTPASDRDDARSDHSQTSEPKTGPAKPSQKQNAPAAVPKAPTDQPSSKPVLDVAAVAGVEGLAEEVAILRASIRHLADGGEMAAHVKALAELRHQIEALCRVLKTQQSLAGRGDDERAAMIERVLEELGDKLGGAQ